MTNKNIVRRTFKVLGPGSSSLYDPKYDANVLIEDTDDDEELINDAIAKNNSLPNEEHDRTYEVLKRGSKFFKKKNNHYLKRIKSTFYDIQDRSYWKIAAVVKENRSSGPGSKTLYYKYRRY